LIDDPRWRGYDVPPKSNANYGWILNMVNKLSDNGVAGFILANGALSGGGEEYKIRRKLIENNLVEAILVLPRNLFYTTDISVTLWIVNKNKKAQSKKVGKQIRNFRGREKELLFMDLRQMGEPFEKKFTQFSDDDIKKVVNTYHQWQEKEIQNIPEFIYSADIEEVAKNDFSLVPSKYIEFINRDENIDFDEKMKALRGDFANLLKAEVQIKNDLLKVFKDLGYEIKL
jgi:type I restriction enzyme M protein